MTATALHVFEHERPNLISLTYRMLGVVEDAEDAVQETWLRFEDADLVSIRNPGAWLTTVATRIAIDQQRSNAVKRETYVGPWLPEPLAFDPMLQASEDPADQAVLAESVSIGFLSILERLSATERAVFLLKEVFALPMVEIAEVVDRSEPATRQIAKRARDRVRAERATKTSCGPFISNGKGDRATLTCRRSVPQGRTWGSQAKRQPGCEPAIKNHPLVPKVEGN